MSYQAVSIAAWSVGKHAVKNTLPAINASSKLHFKGIYTRNLDILYRQAQIYGVHAYSSVNEMLDDAELDAVYIASPVGLHYEQVRAALQANKHVIVEKSSFETLEQAEELIDLAQEKDLVLMEAFMYRFHEQFIRLLELIRSGKYGKVRRIMASFGFPHLSLDDIRYKSDIGGGSLLDAGTYPLSALNQIMGGNGYLYYSSLSVDHGFKVDTNGIALLQGQEATIGIASWCFGADYKNELEVWCEEATVIVRRAFSKPPTLETSIEIYQNGNLHSELRCEPMNHFVAMFQYFASCIDDQNLKFTEYFILWEQMKLIAAIQGNRPV